MKLFFTKTFVLNYRKLPWELQETVDKQIGQLFAGSCLQPEPLVNVLRSFVNPLVQYAGLDQPRERPPPLNSGIVFLKKMKFRP
ncbi:MAG: hypothetical protein C4549_05390 [Deltaproteobacteria bacterium]|jgi:hypothetical protein|nr:MAG: hypothetical protein C4549_05390 [Deltaproteobacteria bacterium]